MQIKPGISPSKIGAVLGVVSIYLSAQSLFNEYLGALVLGPNANITTLLLLDLFSVNIEESIPTWYATLLLFIAGVLLGVIAKAKWELKDRFRYYWISLACIFIYLSMDEGAAIHEILVDPLQALFNPTGYLAFAWQIAAVPLVILFVLLFIPFIFHLPLRWRFLFVSSGAIYVTGALIFDAIGANRWYLEGGITLPFLAIGTIEELFEMVGVSLFIYTLLSFIAANQYSLILSFTPRANMEGLAADAPPVTSNPNPAFMNWKRWAIPLICLILLVNSTVYFWAIKSQTEGSSSISEAVPFYNKVLEQYSGQGVVILHFNGTFSSNNPAIKQYATSLLVLFNDVIVVSLPRDDSSVAFASSALPFDKNDLDAILRANGDFDFTILDTQEIKSLAQGDN